MLLSWSTVFEYYFIIFIVSQQKPHNDVILEHFSILQQQYEWTSGSPVGFQQFKHFYCNNDIVNYSCSIYDKQEKVGNLCPNLTAVKISGRDILHPNSVQLIFGPAKCTLMLLSNMREPDWISVACDVNLVNTVICKRTGKYRAQNVIHIKDESTRFYMCKSTTLVINNKCFAFLWVKNGNLNDNLCFNFKAQSVSANKLSYFYNIPNAVSIVYGSFHILIFQNGIQLQMVKVYKLFDRLRFRHMFDQSVPVSGTVICTFNEINVSIGNNIFFSRTGGYILKTYTCDGINDCPYDDSDEKFCICEERHYHQEQNNCMRLQIRQNVTHCIHNYFMNMTGTCLKFDFKLTMNENEFKAMLVVKIRRTFHAIMVKH